MPFNTLIFDFNGLIVDDEAIHFECFKQVLLEEEIELTDSDYWEIYLGFDDRGLFEAVFSRDQKKLTPKKIKQLISKKNQLYIPMMEGGRLKFFPDVLEFIRNISGYHLAIVSGALRSEIDYVLEKGGVLDRFPVIISADETKHGKPDPEGFLLALAKLKKIDLEIRPETCLVLEDSHAGIEAAHRARMKVVALTHSYPAHQIQDADWVYASILGIKNLLVMSDNY